MNSIEFLALLEKHPLPWTLEMMGEPVAYLRPDAQGWFEGEPGVCSGHENPLTQALADAAPAMAAAAIRLLAHWPEDEQGPCCTEQRDALRASLPASLRP